MISKKNRGANLDRLRAPLFFLGLLFASSIVLSAFEWKTYTKEIPPLGDAGESFDLPDETIFTAVPMEKPLPSSPVKKQVVDVYELIDDDKKVEINLNIPDLDFADEPEVVEIAPKKEVVTEEVFDGFRVDAMPEFPGGEAALRAYLMNNMKYPDMAKDAGAQGTVWVEFVIGKNGQIEEAKILRGIGLGCDEEALRVVNQMPHWKPGKQRGIPVKVRYQLPVTYVLRD